MAKIIERTPETTVVVPAQFVVSLSDQECYDLMVDLGSLSSLRQGTQDIYNVLSSRKLDY